MNIADFQRTHPTYSIMEIVVAPDHVHVETRDVEYSTWRTKVRYTDNNVNAAICDALDFIHVQLSRWEADALPVHG